jgi:hypothetical protein
MLRVVDWDQSTKVLDAGPTVGVCDDVPCVCQAVAYNRSLDH